MQSRKNSFTRWLRSIGRGITLGNAWWTTATSHRVWRSVRVARTWAEWRQRFWRARLILPRPAEWTKPKCCEGLQCGTLSFSAKSCSIILKVKCKPQTPTASCSLSTTSAAPQTFSNVTSTEILWSVSSLLSALWFFTWPTTLPGTAYCSKPVSLSWSSPLWRSAPPSHSSSYLVGSKRKFID